jgi:hypothetical protein
VNTARFAATLAVTGCVLGIALQCTSASVTKAPIFTVEASEDVAADFPGAPRLQSFAWAQWEGKWILIAGRTGGYHGIGQGDVDFPRTRSNQSIWVIEPSESGPAKVHSLAVADLRDTPTVVKDQWISSNLLHYQDHETLYLAGGYGVNSAGDTVTYPILSAVNLPALVKGVIEAKDTFSRTIAYVESPLVQSTGGGLVKLDDGFFYLFGGHVFMGSYRAFEAAEEKTTPKASQTYLGEIRKLRFNKPGGQKLEVSEVERYQDPEFARRDLNVALTINPHGKSLGAAAYGGVFTKEQLNFTHPVYFHAGSAPHVDTAFEQKMSAYSCATMLMFDPASSEMYTTFFGGISRWTWNYSTSKFEQGVLAGKKSNESGYLDGMPWIDHISTLVRTSQQTYEFVQSNRLPSYLGTNAAFIPSPGLKEVMEGTGIFDIGQFRGKRVLAGYLYGGIRAAPKQFPYTDDAPYYTSGNVPTKPSDVILKVYVTAPAAH